MLQAGWLLGCLACMSAGQESGAPLSSEHLSRETAAPSYQPTASPFSSASVALPAPGALPQQKPYVIPAEAHSWQ